jgi:transcription antitermination factor NusG
MREAQMGSDQDCSSPKWFAVRTRINHEKVAFTLLSGKGFESFLPLYREQRSWSDRIKQIEIPMFPGYFFCRTNLEERPNILNTPGVMSVVGSGRTPVPIPDVEVHSLKRFIASEIDAKPHPFLYLGQKVRIDRGPLAGVEGILKEFKTGYRLVVSITLLQRSIAAELDASWLEAAGPPRRADL